MSKVRHVLTCSTQFTENGVCNVIWLIMMAWCVCVCVCFLFFSVRRCQSILTDKLTLSISVKEAFHSKILSESTCAIEGLKHLCCFLKPLIESRVTRNLKVSRVSGLHGYRVSFWVIGECLEWKVAPAGMRVINDWHGGWDKCKDAKCSVSYSSEQVFCPDGHSG